MRLRLRLRVFRYTIGARCPCRGAHRIAELELSASCCHPAFLSASIHTTHRPIDPSLLHSTHSSLPAPIPPDPLVAMNQRDGRAPDSPLTDPPGHRRVLQRPSCAGQLGRRTGRQDAGEKAGRNMGSVQRYLIERLCSGRRAPAPIPIPIFAVPVASGRSAPVACTGYCCLVQGLYRSPWSLGILESWGPGGLESGLKAMSSIKGCDAERKRCKLTERNRSE